VPSVPDLLLSATELSLIETWAVKTPKPDFTFFSKPVQVVQLLDAVADALQTV
jgi:hypothetical protein